MKRRLLSLYALAMCKAIWAVRRVFPPANVEPAKNILLRDFEWDSDHQCENCGFRGRHHFIEWLPERVVTATCPHCLFEATL